MFGGIPNGGPFRNNEADWTEYGVGFSRVAEYTACAMGAVVGVVDDLNRGLPFKEALRRHIGYMEEKAERAAEMVDEYGQPLYDKQFLSPHYFNTKTEPSDPSSPTKSEASMLGILKGAAITEQKIRNLTNCWLALQIDHDLYNFGSSCYAFLLIICSQAPNAFIPLPNHLDNTFRNPHVHTIKRLMLDNFYKLQTRVP